ncbi:gamma subclass chorismate mutase AroQ [Streptomyces niveus]|uniref:gamma subclass chorismate mutase AroQ n=1 Tax=Streptomyces niveus TaxID=193462 RepID=UPI0036D418B2
MPVPAAAAPVAWAGHGTYARLHPLADLSARRLATADLVAAAKRGTGSPVDDPAREQQVLDSVARQAREAGDDPGATVRIFRDQIEANKQVQRALRSLWDTDPSAARRSARTWSRSGRRSTASTPTWSTRSRTPRRHARRLPAPPH